MASNNNCEPCNVVPGAPVTPAPVCPTPACEELVPTECVINNLLDDGCTSFLYEYDQDTGALIIDPQTNAPTPIVNQDGQPIYPLGLSIQPNQNLHTILTNLVDTQNCAFSPNYIAGMLQIIQANPNHPVAQIFCNLVCSCVCDDEELCDVQVEQVVFNPIEPESVILTWYAIFGITYELTFVNTTTLPFQTLTIPGFVPNVPLPGAQYTLDTSTIQGFSLVPGSSYQLTITSTTPQGISCDSITWFFETPVSPECNCDDVQLRIIPPLVAPPAGTLQVEIYHLSGPIPTGYNVKVVKPPGGLTFGPSFYPIEPLPGPTVVCFGVCSPGGAPIPGGQYTVYVTPVCEGEDCVGETQFADVPVGLGLLCDVPNIVSITSNP